MAINKRVTYPSHTTAHLFHDAVADAADVADVGDNLCFCGGQLVA